MVDSLSSRAHVDRVETREAPGKHSVSEQTRRRQPRGKRGGGPAKPKWWRCRGVTSNNHMHMYNHMYMYMCMCTCQCACTSSRVSSSPLRFANQPLLPPPLSLLFLASRITEAGSRCSRHQGSATVPRTLSWRNTRAEHTVSYGP